MSVDKILNVIDLAGSEKKWNAYLTSVRTALPQHLRGEEKRYTSIYIQIANQFLQDPHVKNKKSILTCMFNAPKLGLNPDKVFGHIYFVPYKDILTYQIGYRGMIQLSFNSGKIRQVYADLVYDKDMWDFYRDEKGQHYLHRPSLKEKERGKEICGYSIFEDIDGTPHIHVMDSYHIDEIKQLVLARMKGASTPWSNKLFEPEMRKKTVIRRHWKTEPMSAEIAQVIETEERNEAGEVPSKEEIDNTLESMIEEHEGTTSNDPDPKSPEGKKLNKELDLQAAAEEAAGQGELPFK